MHSLEPGVLLMRTLPGDRFEIIQADDEIEIDEILLVTAQDQHPRLVLVPGVTYGDGIVTFTGANRTVSYGIAGPGSLPHTWRAVLSPDI